VLDGQWISNSLCRWILIRPRIWPPSASFVDNFPALVSFVFSILLSTFSPQPLSFLAALVMPLELRPPLRTMRTRLASFVQMIFTSIRLAARTRTMMTRCG
jgi:hypothetical protein